MVAGPALRFRTRCGAGSGLRGATPLCGPTPRTAWGDGAKQWPTRNSHRVARPIRVRVGSIAHKGMAPAMAVRAAQRGYEAPRAARSRIEPRVPSDSRDCLSLEFAREARKLQTSCR